MADTKSGLSRANKVDEMNTVLLEPAYVLHRRSYRETSFLLELWTPQYGRLSAIARGARCARSPSQGLLQAFTPLMVSWTGKGELKTLTHVEAQAPFLSLHGEYLFAGFYLNELLSYLVQKWDPYPSLYVAYEQALQALAQVQHEKVWERPIAEILRLFEMRLVTELGYGIFPPATDGGLSAFAAERYYRFIPEQGLVPATPGVPGEVFLGQHLKAIATANWQDDAILRAAKRLMRCVLAPLLGTRPIYSRYLFL